MTDLLTIIIIALLGMSLLLTVVWRILRRNPKQEQEPAESMLRSEFSRAQRAGKEVAVIDVKLAPGMKADLLSILGQKKPVIRDYDPVIRLSADRYIVLWPDGEESVPFENVDEMVQQRFRDIPGVLRVNVTIFPRQGKEIEELIASADQN